MLLFTVVLSLQEVYRGKLASSELFTILGGFTSSPLSLLSHSKYLVFKFLENLGQCDLFTLQFIGNLQESSGGKSSWGAVIIAEIIALVAASTVHRFLFSAGLLYEMNKISGYMLSESKSKSIELENRIMCLFLFSTKRFKDTSNFMN
ncbi:hypothetical protein Bca52824_014259 [Brassica carinata]|uniref:Dolichyl-diphosphooligosaccharide--protein glycosyltransferase subunit KCP2 n=1 Tax=Brassica carinata TaxID=52824 RepID=A0A8X7W0F7_BRACI|nr:hypothetical protein Bca52824_014259 [Brassica carinata]